ncbi:MAG TPA: cell cycle transcriptional regulator TrcR [Xanthobacteraceae bacterium]|nr:cell cycle transcriptional regulator TrcR [Xanthobacteraceae bacterium]
MSNAPLMPKATAVWLVDNTALSFDQVADFCKMHPLEIRAIADGDAAQGIKGMDPISTGQLTREEIERGERDQNYRLKLSVSKVRLPEVKKKRGPRYTPVSRRHERPSAILWLLRSHPELKDSQIMRLVGTTKTTIASVKDRTHWNAAGLTPMDPVTLGLCTQIELDFEVQRAAKEKPMTQQYGGATLLPASETTRKEDEFEADAHHERAGHDQDDLNVDAVFAKLKNIGGGRKHDDEDAE